MGSLVSPRHRSREPREDSVNGLGRQLRAPGEHAELLACITANVILVALAFLVVIAGSDWLDTHPFVAKHIDTIRGIVLAGIVALPAMPLTRHVALHAARDGGVRVDGGQFPELHEQLLRTCRMLEVDPVPELYIHGDIEGPAIARSAWRSSIVVLNANLFDTQWKEGLDWLTFVMAGAVGSLRLGHTRWWAELLTGYAAHVPFLRRPLFLKRTFSRDRCAAYVVPDGVRGLLVEAVGKDAVRSVKIARFVEQSRDPEDVWDSLASLRQKLPPLGARARALYRAGFFDEARDLGR
jgi:hypothetical protein